VADGWRGTAPRRTKPGSKESYNKAIAKASDDDRAMALQMLEHWVQGRKD